MFTKFSRSKLLPIFLALAFGACTRSMTTSRYGTNGKSSQDDFDDAEETSEQSVAPFNKTNFDQGGGDSVIHLPFSIGDVRLCTQGVGGTYSHNKKATKDDLDFDTSNSAREEIYAPVSGTAHVHTEAATGSGFGNHICIDIGGGYYVVIGHFDEILVCDGCEVAAGELIGIEGCTGTCTGDHVHIGLHKGDATLPAENGESVPATYYVQDASGNTQTLQSDQFVCGTDGDGKSYTSALKVANSHPDGTLVKTANDVKVYVLTNGELRWLKNENVFWSLGYSFDNLVVISDEELGCYSPGPDIAEPGFVKAIRDPIGQTWLLQGLSTQSGRYRIKVAETGWEAVLASFGLSHNAWNPPPTVSWTDSYLTNWPEMDGFAKFRNGTLVKEFNKSDVYVAESNAAMPIKDWQTYLLLGFVERPIVEVGSGVVKSVQKVVGDCGGGLYCISSDVVKECAHPMLVAPDEPYVDQDDTGETPEFTAAGYREEEEVEEKEEKEAKEEKEEREEGGSRRLQPAPSSASFVISYPDFAPRTLNVQMYTSTNQLGNWWDWSVFDNDGDVSLSLDNVPDDICGFRLNVAEGDPAYAWLCSGNGQSASLDPSATVLITYKGDAFSKASLLTWSDPYGAGCSALLKVSSMPNCL